MNNLADMTVTQCLKLCGANACADPRKNSRGCIAFKTAVRIMKKRQMSWHLYFRANPWMRDAVAGYKRIFGHGYGFIIDDVVLEVSNSIMLNQPMKPETRRMLMASPADVVTVAGLEFDWTTVCGLSKPNLELQNAIVIACFNMGFSKEETKAAIEYPLERFHYIRKVNNSKQMAAHIKNVLCNLKDGGLDAIYGIDWISSARGVLRDRPPHYAMLRVSSAVAVAAAHQYRSAVEKLIESRLGRSLANRIPLMVERGPVQDDRDANEPQRPVAKQRYDQL